MKFTYNWLKDFVDIKLSPQALADKLTMAGIEVVSLEKAGEDFVFEAEITSNRPDWLSIVGIAREVAAITNKKLRACGAGRREGPRASRSLKSQTLKIDIEDKKDCPLYTARIIRDVKVGASTVRLKERLELIGCRSVNNIVDITNYVMFTRGQPLHAFDLDKLRSDTIGVRRARAQETLAAIDGQSLRLDKDILVITDASKPVAIAGVMGGKDTEVTEATRNILLEAAVFNPVVVRGGRRKLGIQSESSYRFERGVDAGSVDFISAEAGKMIMELAGGTLILHKASALLHLKEKRVSLDLDRAKKILKMDSLSAPRAKQILHGLGFTAKIIKKNIFAVTVPSWRQDVSLEADCIEEIARIAGYDRIPTTLPSIIPQFSGDHKRELVLRTKNILAGLGLNEVITYTLVPQDWVTDVNPRQLAPLGIANPLSREQEVLRTTLIPSLFKCVAYNLNQKREHVALFEIADVFFGQGTAGPKEELSLGIALCGTKALWAGQGRVRDTASMLHAKGIVEALVQRLGIEKDACKFVPKGDRVVVSVRDREIGLLLKPRRDILELLDIKNKEVCAAEIFLDKLLSEVRLKRRVTPFSRFPGISRDISLVVKDDVPASRLIDLITTHGAALLEEAEITDYYKGRQVELGFKGITITCRYSSGERTLTDAEVNALHSAVVGELEKQLQARIR